MPWHNGWIRLPENIVVSKGGYKKRKETRNAFELASYHKCSSFLPIVEFLSSSSFIGTALHPSNFLDHNQPRPPKPLQRFRHADFKTAQHVISVSLHDLLVHRQCLSVFSNSRHFILPILKEAAAVYLPRIPTNFQDAVLHG
jgi:hypothetical protein